MPVKEEIAPDLPIIPQSDGDELHISNEEESKEDNNLILN